MPDNFLRKNSYRLRFCHDYMLSSTNMLSQKLILLAVFEQQKNPTEFLARWGFSVGKIFLLAEARLLIRQRLLPD